MPDRARGLVPFQFDRHVRWGRLPIGAVVPVSSHAGSPRPMTQTPRAAATQELRRHYEPIVARLVNSDWTVWSLKPMDRTCSRVHAWPVRTPTKSLIECRATRSITWPGSLFGCAATSRRRRPTVRPGRRRSNGATTSSRRFDLSEWIQTLSLRQRCLHDRVRAEPIPA